MEITRKISGGDIVDIELAGRLDGYWSDHLTSALSEVVRAGKHHIRIDCSRVTFLSSAGIAVLMKFHKELGRISGTLQVVNASTPVVAVLRMTRLDAHLLARTTAAAPEPSGERSGRQFEREEVAFTVFDLDAAARLACRSIGSAAPLAECASGDDRSTSLEGMTPTLAVGVGAFGENFSDCRTRFGELLSVAGATAYQPADGTNVPDYLIASGPLGADVRVLYCLTCEGRFSHLVRFETIQPDATAGLSTVLGGCLAAATADSVGIAIVAEAAGLVGAALRRSPAEPRGGEGFFDHPAVRTRLSFTAERAFTRSVALAAGVVTRAISRPGGFAPPDPPTRSLAGAPSTPLRSRGSLAPLVRATDRNGNAQLRPIGPTYSGHFHAAAFRFRPIRKGAIDLGETISSLFEPDQLLGVLHLLHDDRGVAGAGESEFVRGACWVAPIAGEW